MRYKQLTQEERHQISTRMKAGHTPSEIALILGHHKSTISREINPNTSLGVYQPKPASSWLRKTSPVSPSCSDRIGARSKSVGGLKTEIDISISHEWIYQYVLRDKAEGGDLYQHWRCQNSAVSAMASYHLIDRRSIDERPTVVDPRSRIGDWELDPIIGKGHQQAIVSLTEGKSC